MCTQNNGGCHVDADCTTDPTLGTATCACKTNYITPTGSAAGIACGK